jgi:flavin reductase (DIM6/NTAB) family NADH-FMN oxidoreductase RutF
MRIDFDPETMDRQSFYRLLTATVVPRPIAWVSTVSGDGVANLAPAKLGGKWYRLAGR